MAEKRKNDNPTENLNKIEKYVKKPRKRRHHSPEEQLLFKHRHQIELCMKNSTPDVAISVYEKMKFEKLNIPSYIYEVLINLCGNAIEKNKVTNNVGKIDYKNIALSLFQELKEKLLCTSNIKSKISETIYSTMIKICSIEKEIKNGFTLIEEMEKIDSIYPKLRTFSPLLHACCESNLVEEAFLVYQKILNHNILLSEDEYNYLLKVLSSNKISKSTNGITKFQLLEEYMENILKPEKTEIIDTIKNLFINDDPTWSIKVEATVDKTGYCSECKTTLSSIELSIVEKKNLASQVEELVCTSETRTSQFNAFKNWLQLDENKNIEVIIDAANVGYYKQNFEGGGFNLAQIESMRYYYEEVKKKKVFIILHKRRALNDQVSLEYKPMVEKWLKNGTMYCCEKGNNDDWYWLYAAITINNRILLVTNDEMRDHHFQMLHHKSFVHWKERHQVHYDLCGYINKNENNLSTISSIKYSRVKVFEPSIYSIRSQKTNDNLYWHFLLMSTVNLHSTVVSNEQECVTNQKYPKWLCISKELFLKVLEN